MRCTNDRKRNKNINVHGERHECLLYINVIAINAILLLKCLLWWVVLEEPYADKWYVIMNLHES